MSTRELFALAGNADSRVDLATQSLTLPNGTSVEFPIDAFAKRCLLEGVDELGYIMQQEAAIAAYEARRIAPVRTIA